MLYILSISEKFKQIERITEEKWELIQAYPNSEISNYVTLDIEDEELSKHEIETIIWEKIYDKYNHYFRKIIVPFTPHDINAMEKAAEIEKEKVYEKLEKMKKLYMRDQEIKTERIKKEKASPERMAQKIEIGKIRSELDEIIPMEMDNIHALLKWKELGFPQPAPHKIEHIKNSLGMSWRDFTERMEKNLTLKM